MPTKCYIFDIDGTLFDPTHRLHLITAQRIQDPNPISRYPEGKFSVRPLVPDPDFKPDWDAFFAACKDDPPIEHMIELANILGGHKQIICVTGRPERVRPQTIRALAMFLNAIPLTYMRADGDHRPDHVVKLELLAEVRFAGFEPVMVFDDRASVVKMWRGAGIPCAQVADGDF